ncbi:MAG TPA: dTMP kinase [Cyanobacteria bacterium UBA11372]|nr:dTMP kinase [Cyanobacteria bacterium UBA11372]
MLPESSPELASSRLKENVPSAEKIQPTSARKGKLIAFEGVEGCGKTTQLRRLGQWLQDSGWLLRLKAAGVAQEVVVTREPGGTELGLGLRRLLLEVRPHLSIHERAELFLYAADRAQHVEEVLLPELARGAIVLCDRYTDSTIAYQGYGRGLSLSLIEQLNQIATNGLQSDLTLWLDLDAAIGLARKQQQKEITRMEQADITFHQRVQEGFTALAKAHPTRIARVDASLSQESVQEQIQMIVEKKFSQWYPNW